VNVLHDISYQNIPVTNWLGVPDITSLKLDLYSPASDPPGTFRPLIVLIHGGGFKTGDKSGLANECMSFARKGYVVASINYRVGWTYVSDINMRFPNCAAGGDMSAFKKATYRATQDAHAAIRFLAHNANTYGIDPNWVFVGGGSAGAFTSILLSYMQIPEWSTYLTFPVYTSLGDLRTSGNNFTNTFTIRGIFDNCGAIFDTAFINPSENIPLIGFHGDADPIVPIDSNKMMGCSGYISICGSRAIHYKMAALGICTELNVLHGGGHSPYTSTSAEVEYQISRTACFFRDILCSACPSAPVYNFANSFAMASSMFPPNCSCSSPRLSSLENNNQSSDDISITLNPGNHYFSLHGNSEHAYYVQLCDMQGKVMFTTKGNLEQINNSLPSISSWSNGIYIIKLRDLITQQVHTEKLVKQ